MDICCSPDGRTFATTSNSTVEIWDCQSLCSVQTIDIKGGKGCLYSPDGTKFLVITNDMIKVYVLPSNDIAMSVELSYVMYLVFIFMTFPGFTSMEIFSKRTKLCNL